MPGPRLVMVRYTVKPGWESDNEALVQAVYDELEVARPAGFTRFQADFRHRCDEGPTITAMTKVGSFRVFGD